MPPSTVAWCAPCLEPALAVGAKHFLITSSARGICAARWAEGHCARSSRAVGNVYAPMSGWEAAKRAERREACLRLGRWRAPATQALPGLAIRASISAGTGGRGCSTTAVRSAITRGYEYGVEYRPRAVGGGGPGTNQGARRRALGHCATGVNLSLGEALVQSSCGTSRAGVRLAGPHGPIRRA